MKVETFVGITKKRCCRFNRLQRTDFILLSSSSSTCSTDWSRSLVFLLSPKHTHTHASVERPLSFSLYTHTHILATNTRLTLSLSFSLLARTHTHSRTTRAVSLRMKSNGVLRRELPSTFSLKPVALFLLSEPATSFPEMNEKCELTFDVSKNQDFFTPYSS